MFLSESIASFVLRIKNPCVDPDYVGVYDNPLPSKVYMLGDLAPDGLIWQHTDFFESHPVCGATTYVAIFKDQELSTRTAPLKYNSDLMQFTLFTDNVDYVGTHELVVEAWYTDYPNSLIHSRKTAQIEIVSPCANIEAIFATD